MRKYYNDPNNLKEYYEDELRRQRKSYEDKLQKRASRTIQWVALAVSLLALIKKLI